MKLNKNKLRKLMIGCGVFCALAVKAQLSESQIVDYIAGKLPNAEAEMGYTAINSADNSEIKGIADVYLPGCNNYAFGVIQVKGDNEQSIISRTQNDGTVLADSVEQGSESEKQWLENFGAYVKVIDNADNFNQLERVIEDVKSGYFGITSGIEDKAACKNFGLSQNYPNPFNGSTKIKYKMDKAGKAEINVYDLKGRKVRNLVNKVQGAGDYEVNFNADDLKSGVYFYEANLAGKRQTKRMVVTK